MDRPWRNHQGRQAPARLQSCWLIGIWGSTKKVEPAGPFKFAFDRLDVGGREYAAMKLTLMLLGGSALILVGILAMYNAGGGKTFNTTGWKVGWLDGWLFELVIASNQSNT